MGVSKDEVDAKGAMFVCNADGGTIYFSQCTDLSTCAANTCTSQVVYPKAAYDNVKAGNCATLTVDGQTLSVIVNPVANLRFLECPTASGIVASGDATYTVNSYLGAQRDGTPLATTTYNATPPLNNLGSC